MTYTVTINSDRGLDQEWFDVEAIDIVHAARLGIKKAVRFKKRVVAVREKQS